MSELIFKGKEFVYNHHLSVPYRPLQIHADKSITPKGQAPRVDGNLIVHGDNLHALKALLPMYAGKVDCIFIDPPYNTGNEGWAYNDNVNSPYIQEWFQSNPVNKDDLLRHDKWLNMMWPRLRLLHELLSDTGSFWMTLDDNEIHRARMMLDEIFGEESFGATFIWKSRQIVDSRNESNVSQDHEYVLLYTKQSNNPLRGALSKDDKYSNPDNDARGAWMSNSILGLANTQQRPNLHYKVVDPKTGFKYECPESTGWRYSVETMQKKIDEERILFPSKQDGRPREKKFLAERVSATTGFSTVLGEEVGFTLNGTRLVRSIINDADIPFPKSLELVKILLKQSTDEQSIVLDSFAGSGTTAHAVLALNAEDGGERRFILCEGEAYADTLTAERVRRVMNGYSFTGKQKTELLRENINFTALKNSHKLMEKIASIENLPHEFDRISKTVKDGVLLVEGEKDVTEKTAGLGGTFTYCSLGAPIDLNELLAGRNLPNFEQFGNWLFHTATNQAFEPSKMDESRFYLGESASYHVWLYYKSDLAWLISRESALTLDKAEALAKELPFSKTGKKHLVFAPAKFVPNKMLLPLGVEHAPLPFALFKIER